LVTEQSSRVPKLTIAGRRLCPWLTSVTDINRPARLWGAEGDHVTHGFVTGASGWLGSAVVGDLLATGREVTVLARSAGSAAALEAKGAHVRRGDPDDLRAGVKDGEAVKHDFANPAVPNAAERVAVQTIGDTPRGHWPRS
jgi:hypothetical protein